MASILNISNVAMSISMKTVVTSIFNNVSIVMAVINVIMCMSGSKCNILAMAFASYSSY